MAKPPLTVIGHAGPAGNRRSCSGNVAEALRAAIDRDGEVVQTRTGPRAHPGLRDELSNRAFIVRTLEMTTAL